MATRMPGDTLRPSEFIDPALGNRPGGRRSKRYLWPLGAAVPGIVGASWLGVTLTGSAIFWWTGPILTFLITPLLDHIVGQDSDNPSDSALVRLQEDPFYRWVTYLYLPIQYLSLLLACWLWSGGGWLTMDFIDKVGLMLSTGIMGGIAINAAHELGHKKARAERRLSKVALAQTGYGHFYVEHNRGHHVRVATPEDPASSRLGQSIYHFLPRSILGGLRSAWNLERNRLRRKGQSLWTLRNDVLNAWLMTLVLFTGLVLWFGMTVLPWLIGQAVIGFCLLETINYMEHYGLQRQKLPNGRYERVNHRHSWNSNTVIANVFLFHLQRHADHHANPLRPYQTLRHNDESPQLPSGYGTMFLLAWLPPLWRRVMDPRVALATSAGLQR